MWAIFCLFLAPSPCGLNFQRAMIWMVRVSRFIYRRWASWWKIVCIQFWLDLQLSASIDKIRKTHVVTFLLHCSEMLFGSATRMEVGAGSMAKLSSFFPLSRLDKNWHMLVKRKLHHVDLIERLEIPLVGTISGKDNQLAMCPVRLGIGTNPCSN